MIRRTLSTLAALTLAGALTACSDSAKDPAPKATDSTTSAAPTPTPTWQDAYTEKQLAGYDAALQRWESYLNRSEPIWAAGKATPQAEELFKEYFPDPIWRTVNAQLKTYEQVEVRSEGQAQVYWSKATEISKNALNVTIEQCVNYSAGETSQRGEVVKVADWAKEPRLRVVQLSRPKVYGWLIYSVQDASAEKRPKRCAP